MMIPELGFEIPGVQAGVIMGTFIHKLLGTPAALIV